jgi:hypothetical protein
MGKIIMRKEYDYMRLPNISNSDKIRSAFFVGMCCGIIGILPDIDHVISYWIQPLSENRRIFHVAIFITCCLVLCSLVAYGGRFYNKYILRNEIEK